MRRRFVALLLVVVAAGLSLGVPMLRLEALAPPVPVSPAPAATTPAAQTTVVSTRVPTAKPTAVPTREPAQATPRPAPGSPVSYARVRQIAVERTSTKWADWTYPDKVNGLMVIMSTSLREDLQRLQSLLRRLNGGFWTRFHYPMAIVHEDFDAGRRAELQKLASNTDLIFVQIAFELDLERFPIANATTLYTVKHRIPNPEHPTGWHIHEHGLKPFKRGNLGYQHMCRFFGGAGYLLPFFDGYEYVWRLDTDSQCQPNLGDAFAELVGRGGVYGWNLEKRDGGDVVEGLWNTAQQYVRERGITPHFLNGSPHHRSWGEDGLFSGTPMFYTNFEVVELAFLRSAEYQDFFNYLDATGNIFYHRWGDAPIRWLGLAMYVDRSRVLRMRHSCMHR